MPIVASTSGGAALTISSNIITNVLPVFDSNDFQRRVAVAAVAYAYNVKDEAGGTTNHAERLTYARQVVQNPMAYTMQSILYAVVSDGVTIPTSTDQQIADRVLAVWNFLAGI